MEMDMCGMDGNTGHAEYTQRLRAQVNAAKVLSINDYESKLASFDKMDLTSSFDHVLLLKTRKDVPQLMKLLSTTPFQGVRSAILKSKHIYQVKTDDDVKLLYTTVTERCATWQRTKALRNIERFGTSAVSEYFKEHYTCDFDNSSGWQHSSHLSPSYSDTFQESLEELQQAKKESKIDKFFEEALDVNSPDYAIKETRINNYEYFKQLEAEIPREPGAPNWHKFALSRRRVATSIVRGSFTGASTLEFQHVLDTVDISVWKKSFVDDRRVWKSKLNQKRRLQIIQHPRFKEYQAKFGSLEVGLFQCLDTKHRKAIFAALLDGGETDMYRLGYKIQEAHLRALTLEERQDYKDMFLHSINQEGKLRFIGTARDVLRIHLFEPSIEEILKLALTQQDRDERQVIIRSCEKSVLSRESLTALLKALTTRWKNETGPIRQSLITSICQVPLEFWHNEHGQYLLEVYENEKKSRDASVGYYLNQAIANAMSSTNAFDGVFPKLSFLWPSIRYVFGVACEISRKTSLRLNDAQVDKVFQMIKSEHLAQVVDAGTTQEFQNALNSGYILHIAKALLPKEADVLTKLDRIKRKIESFRDSEEDGTLLDLYHKLNIEFPYPKSLKVYLNDVTSQNHGSHIGQEHRKSLVFPSVAFTTYLQSIVESPASKTRLRNDVCSIYETNFTHWPTDFQKWYLQTVATNVEEAYFLLIFDAQKYQEMVASSVKATLEVTKGRVKDDEAARTELIHTTAAQKIPFVQNKLGFEQILEERLRSKELSNAAIPLYLHLLKQGAAADSRASAIKLLESTDFGISVRKQLFRFLASVSSAPIFIKFVADYADAGRIKHRDVKDTILDELALLAVKKVHTAELFKVWQRVFLIPVEDWSWHSNFNPSVAQPLEKDQQAAFVSLFLKLHIDEDLLPEVKDDHDFWHNSSLVDNTMLAPLIPLDLILVVNERLQKLLFDADAASKQWQQKQIDLCFYILRVYTQLQTTNDAWIPELIKYFKELYPSSDLIQTKTNKAKQDILSRIFNQLFSKYGRYEKPEIYTVRDVFFLHSLDQMLWSPERSLIALYRLFTAKLKISILVLQQQALPSPEYMQQLLVLRNRLAKVLKVTAPEQKQSFDSYFISIILDNSVRYQHPNLIPEFVENFEAIINSLPEEEVYIKAEMLCYAVKRYDTVREGVEKNAFDFAWKKLEELMASHGSQIGITLAGKLAFGPSSW